MLHMTKTFAGAPIIRTRNPEILKECNIVVDVGATYDPENLRFDHHQPEFQGTLTTVKGAYKTRLSSAGLVYKHFGKEVLQGICKGMSEQDLDILYDRVYAGLLEEVDGVDNGVEPYSCECGKLTPNYKVSTRLGARVARCNPRWNEETTPDTHNERFVKAMDIAREEFLDRVDYIANSWMPARAIVLEAVQNRGECHSSGKVVALKQFCPWEEHLFDIERELKVTDELLYILFPGSPSGDWRVRAIGVEGSTFGMRKPLPWKGLRDATLDKESGIDGCIFVHASGFIGGNRSYEGALKMAVKACSM
eukprot:Sspe_Gene.76283::Locus_47662_Transcript_1_1_Confidence_1.000_Length_1025::g.76283::m.76283